MIKILDILFPIINHARNVMNFVQLVLIKAIQSKVVWLARLQISGYIWILIHQMITKCNVEVAGNQKDFMSTALIFAKNALKIANHALFKIMSFNVINAQ